MYQSGNLVKKTRESQNITQRELAKKAQTTNPTISAWEKGTDLPSLSMGKRIAKALGLPENELLNLLEKDRNERDKEDLKRKLKSLDANIDFKTDPSSSIIIHEPIKDYELNKVNLIRIPILGQVPAGPLREVLPKLRSEAEEFEYIPSDGIFNPDLMFGLHVSGESMSGKDINDGDVIIIDTNIQPTNGDIVVAMVNDSVTVKTFYRTGDILTLQSANAKIEPIILTGKNTDHVRIVGKVIRLIKKL